MNIEDIKQIMDGFDPAALLPDLTSVAGKMELACRIAVLLGPLLLLALGLMYFFLAPKEANHRFGYRCYFGMGSVAAWRFTQRLAGMIWAGLGLVLSVVMLLMTLGFRNLAIMDQLWRAVTCLAWEVGLIVVSIGVINFTVARFYDAEGQLRPNAPHFELKFRK